jgi:hypothetical protein
MQKINNQDGQGMMEYVILSSLIGIFCLIAIKGYGESIQTRIEWMNKKIVQNIRN